MRRLVALAVAGVALAVPVGCCTKCCDGCAPIIRQDQLLEQSEDVRQVEGWHRDARRPLPPDISPERIHGGIH